LAKAGEIEEGACFGAVVVDVGGGEDDSSAGDRVGLEVFGAAPFAATLAADETDKVGAELPVFGVAGFIFWFDWHLIGLGSDGLPDVTGRRGGGPAWLSVSVLFPPREPWRWQVYHEADVQIPGGRWGSDEE
jgi:hypothetical protein